MQLQIIMLPERRQQIQEEVSRLGIDAHFWAATVMKNTVHGISLSHRKIVQWAKDVHMEWVAIAEDDVVFTSLKSWQYFLDNKPEDFDIYLGGYYSGIPMENGTLYSFCGLHCYIIHSRYFDKFLSTPIGKNIDAAQRGNGVFKFCTPLIAKQRNGYSFHRKKIVNDDHHLNGKVFLSD